MATKTGEGFVDKAHIAKIISNKTNIPLEEVGTTEKGKLLNLEELLHMRVIGQDEAITAVSDAMRRARAGLKDIKRPMGVFLFLGPTGVGKTELSKALAEAYFGSENNMIRLDMSEYQDKTSINRMIGAPPGYAESQAGGQLTQHVRERPFSLILLDEIEKANPDIINLFLQVFEDGRLSDSMGRVVDFTNTIIIATSNAGAEVIRQSIKESINIETLKEKLLDYLQREGIFKPEFLNRFDAIVAFKPLTLEQIVEVVELMLKKLSIKLSEQDVKLKITDEALKKLAKTGYDPVFGARPMRRLIQERVENALAKRLLTGEIKRGDVIEIDAQDI